MKNEKELKYAALMAKAYNWLNEFSRGKGHAGFGFAVSQRGNYLFQGRGDKDSPKTTFYVEIGKRSENYTYLTLDFFLTDDFARITKISAHMGWQEPNDAYKTLAQQLSNNVGNQKSVTIQIVEAANEDGVKQGLQNWLSEHCVQIVTAYGQDRRPEDKVRADRLTQLKNNGFLSVGEDGIVSISQTADFVTGSNNLNGEIKVGAGLVPPPDGMPVNHDVTAPVNRAYNRLVFGAPGTGKSHRLEEERKEDSDFKTNYERVTFYPTYSYAQFVGTYKPVMKRPEDKDKEEIAYEFVPGPFLRVLVKALNEAPDASGKKKGWCLIIEEINRANAAAVFGDVFQLLDRGSNGESEYAIAASEDVKKYLEKKLTDTGKQALNALAGSTDTLKIPANMYLWATMNSADQGVTPLDTAFKRRWEFEYIGVDDEAKGDCKGWTIEGHNYNWNDIRQFINGALSAHGVNEDKLMGPYFTKPPQGSPVILEKSFGSKVLMYLWEDAGRMIRAKLLGDEVKTYSALLEKWKSDGIKVFEGLVSGYKLDKASREIYSRLAGRLQKN